MDKKTTLSYDTAAEVFNAIAYVTCRFYKEEYGDVPDIEWLNSEALAWFKNYCKAEGITDIELPSYTKN